MAVHMSKVGTNVCETHLIGEAVYIRHWPLAPLMPSEGKRTWNSV
jgi:hypothetical protein